MRRSVVFTLVALLALAAGCGARPAPPVTMPPGPSEPPAAPAAPAEPEAPPPVEREPPPPPVATADPCALEAGDAPAIETIGLTEPVAAGNAPAPQNESERLLFRQLYETLVRVDCEGRARPGLAASWIAGAAPRTWTLTLRENARFADGSLVTGADVVQSWSTGNTLRPDVAALVESATAVDDHSLAIVLREGDAEPLALADPRLAVVRRSPDSSWPLGTRDLKVVEPPSSDQSGLPSITLESVPRPGEPVRRLRALMAPGRDPRDFLDNGVHLLVTRDPAALEYAASLPQYESMPLPWLWTHVFISPWRTASAPPLDAAARQALAADSVRGEARGAEEPFWWQALGDCALPPPAPLSAKPPASGRIVYETGDEAARDLAERLVGLQRASALPAALVFGVPPVRFGSASGLRGEAFARARAAGAEAGYVVRVARAPLAPCAAFREMAGRMPWLVPEAIVPLADTRPRAIVMRGAGGAVLEGDGALLVTPLAQAQRP